MFLKFRSMYTAMTARMWPIGPSYFQMKQDRAAPVGRFIRRYSLDELPQLINVLRGEMSLVGPRPLCCSTWDPTNRRRRAGLPCIPGITGLWGW